MKKSKKIIWIIVIVIIVLSVAYLALLQIPKSYLSQKYNLEANKIESVYFVPSYFRNESNRSSNIFDFEKINPRWKFKYNDNDFYVDYIDGKFYDDFQLTQLYDWSVKYLQKNIDSHISAIEIYSKNIYFFQMENNNSFETIKENQICDFLDYVIKDYTYDFVIYYSVDNISSYIDDTSASTIKDDLQNKICKHFNFNRKPTVYIVAGEKIEKKDIDLHNGYFLDYKQRKLLKKEKCLI